MMWGLANLGGARYRKLVKQTHVPGWAQAIFFDVPGFGPALPLIQDLGELGTCPRMTIPLLWSDSHKFSDEDIPEILRRARLLKREAISKFPHVDFRVSGPWEHQLSVRSAKEFRKRVIDELGDCSNAQYVNNPSPGGSFLGGTLNECHGAYYSRPIDGRYDFNFDGTDAANADIAHYRQEYKGAETFYFWIPQFNGKKTTKDTTPRKDRQAWPTAPMIESVTWFATKIGKVNLPDRWIYKVHAEQSHPVTEKDGDAGKPMIICPIRTDAVRLETKAGKLIARAMYRSPYEGAIGGYRYYFNDYGFRFAEKATRIQGFPRCKVVVDGKAYGNVNPSFRLNDYHKP